MSLILDTIRCDVNVNLDILLCRSCNNEPINEVRYLIYLGADINFGVKQIGSSLPLRTAITYERYDLCALFLQCGAIIDTSDSKHNYIELAKHYGYFDIAYLLKQYEACIINNPNKKDGIPFISDNKYVRRFLHI